MPLLTRTLPFHQLPPGFGRTLDHPPDPPLTPRPASTLVLLRTGPGRLETLLLKRSRRLGFIPGAYVFPGGGVDPADANPSLLPRMSGLTPDAARARLHMDEGGVDGNVGPTPPPMAFFAAALRETFEETGILLAAPPGACRTISADGIAAGGAARSHLLEGKRTFLQVLEDLSTDLDAGALQFIAHWVTPEPEPRRYDTRFFAVEVPRACSVEPDLREIEEAFWLAPTEALDRNRAGLLPLVYPTLRTLEDLEAFSEAPQALEYFRGRAVSRLLPRLERKPGGIEVVVDELEHGHPGAPPNGPWQRKR